MTLIESESDKAKFTTIYENYADLLFYVANDVLHDIQDAEDAVHDALISIARHLDKIDDPNSPKARAFLVISARNKAIDIFRKRQRIIPSEITDELIGTVTEASSTQNKDLAYIISQLPEAYRDVLILRFDIGFSVREIADIISTNRSTVLKRIQRAKSALAKLLTSSENGDK